MILKVIDHADNDETHYYEIPSNVGDYIIDRAGKDVKDPCMLFSEDFSDLLYLIASPCVFVYDNSVDITFHLC